MAEEILKMDVLNDIYREDLPVITREIACNNYVNDTAMLLSFINRNPPESFMRKFMNVIRNNYSRRKVQVIGPDHNYAAKHILLAYIREKLTKYSIVIFYNLSLLSRNDTIEQAIYNQYINMKFNITKENVRYILNTYNETILIILDGLQNKPHILEFISNETLKRCNVIVTTSSYTIKDYQLVEIIGLTDDTVRNFVQRSLENKEYTESIINLMANSFDLPYNKSPMLLKSLCTIINIGDTGVLQSVLLTRADIIFRFIYNTFNMSMMANGQNRIYCECVLYALGKLAYKEKMGASPLTVNDVHSVLPEYDYANPILVRHCKTLRSIKPPIFVTFSNEMINDFCFSYYIIRKVQDGANDTFVKVTVQNILATKSFDYVHEFYSWWQNASITICRDCPRRI